MYLMVKPSSLFLSLPSTAVRSYCLLISRHPYNGARAASSIQPLHKGRSLGQIEHQRLTPRRYGHGTLWDLRNHSRSRSALLHGAPKHFKLSYGGTCCSVASPSVKFIRLMPIGSSILDAVGPEQDIACAQSHTAKITRVFIVVLCHHVWVSSSGTYAPSAPSSTTGRFRCACTVIV